MISSLNVLANNQTYESTIFFYLQFMNKLCTLQNSPNNIHWWHILPMSIAIPKHLEFSTKFIFPLLHNRVKQFRFLFWIYNTCSNHLLFDETTLGSKSTWRSFKFSRGGDSRAIGSCSKVWWKFQWGHGTLNWPKILIKNKFHIKITKRNRKNMYNHITLEKTFGNIL